MEIKTISVYNSLQYRLHISCPKALRRPKHSTVPNYPELRLFSSDNFVRRNQVMPETQAKSSEVNLFPCQSKHGEAS